MSFGSPGSGMLSPSGPDNAGQSGLAKFRGCT